MSTGTITGTEWINATDAGRILGVSGIAIRKLGDRGRLTMRQIPECRPMYRRDEVERLKEESVKPGVALQAK